MNLEYTDLRSQNAAAFKAQYASILTLGFGSWGPLNQMRQYGRDPQLTFNAVHDAAMIAVAAQQQAQNLDWSGLWGTSHRMLEHAEPMREAIGITRRWLCRHRHAWDTAVPVLGSELHRTFNFYCVAESTGLAAARKVGAIDPATILATILTAVLGVVCPPTAAFAGILEPILATIIKVLFDSLTKQSKLVGGAMDAFNPMVTQWAAEAKALAA